MIDISDSKFFERLENTFLSCVLVRYEHFVVRPVFCKTDNSKDLISLVFAFAERCCHQNVEERH